MGVPEDINWLNEDRGGVGKIFEIIAEEGSVGLRRLKALHGSENWWPVKVYARSLIERGLVADSEGGYKLTETGKKVLEGIRATKDMKQL